MSGASMDMQNMDAIKIPGIAKSVTTTNANENSELDSENGTEQQQSSRMTVSSIGDRSLDTQLESIQSNLTKIALSDSSKAIGEMESRTIERTASSTPSDSTSKTPNGVQGVRYIPALLAPEGRSFEDVRKSLEDIIVSKVSEGASENDGAVTSLKPLDELGTVIVSSHSLAAYASTLNFSTLRKLTAHIVADTGFWFSRLFRFYESCMFCHDESREGLIRVSRMLLNMRYEKYALDGFNALYSRPPIIYISSAIEQEGGVNKRMSVGQAICSSLGLPRACLRVIPQMTIAGAAKKHAETDGASKNSADTNSARERTSSTSSVTSTMQSSLADRNNADHLRQKSPIFQKMNLTFLQEQIEHDLNKGCVPLLLIATAGSSICGQNEDFDTLLELCKSKNIWLHVEGHALASLCLSNAGNLPARCGDSMTLHIGQWLGVPPLPYVTLYRQEDSQLAHSAGLTLFNIHSQLHCLPLWTMLQCLGANGVRQKVLNSFKLCDILVSHLSKLDENIIKVGRQFRVADKERGIIDFNELVSKPVKTSYLFDSLHPVVTFKFHPSANTKQNGQPDGAGDNSQYFKEDYVNNLNIWLAQMLSREELGITLELVDVPEYRACLKFSPLESSHIKTSQAESMEAFVKALDSYVNILVATVAQKKHFHRCLDGTHADFGRHLRPVEIKSWAGLGGVRYIPEAFVESLNDLSDEDKEYINRVNEQLVNNLQSTDSAFSLGDGTDGMMCVRFGMVTEHLVVDELISMVLQAGLTLEENSKQMRKMEELVREAVDQANKALEKETEEKIYQEGLLRHIPIVGNLVQWWSPPADELGPGVKGRSFNLASGMVETTENTYKYHMQMKGADACSPGTPPPPLQQIQVGKPLHSRSDSQGSQPSQKSL